LLVIGAAAVAGVLVYNRVQERATRREAERAFGSRHPDVLLEEPSGRREPTLERSPPRPSPSDPRVDYVVELDGVSPGAVRPVLAALERRFARRATLADAEGGKLYASLQMVSRQGVISEAELLEFRSQVETLAGAQGAAVSAPQMREALEGAHALDRACTDVDVQIALHVLGPAQAELGDQPFAVTRRADGVTLLLDVPRTPDLAQSYAAMVKAARRLGGRVVDDNGTTLDERALAAIGVEVESMHARLAEIGIEPGSPLALRLFS
jgi:ZipA, C-terminal FtsZ-binding domain